MRVTMDSSNHFLYVAAVLLLSHVAHSFKLSIRPKKSYGMEVVDQVEQASLFFKDSFPRGERVANQGERLVLDCDAGGAPAPTIHWLFNGQRIQQGETGSVFDDAASYEHNQVSGMAGDHAGRMVLGLSTTRSRLFVDCFTGADVGEYTCVADTPTQRIHSTVSIMLGVGGAGDCTEKRGPGLPARIFMWTAHRLELLGGDAQLFCRADGNPAPQVTWYDREGMPITPDRPNFQVLPNGDLLIQELDFMTHMGVYKCVTSNSAGEDDISTFVYPTTL